MTTRSRLILDTGLVVALLLAFSPTVTGISIHEWLSLALIVPAVLHLVINWEWVVRTTRNILGKAHATSTLNLIVDTLLFGAIVTVMLSGLLVSQVISSALGVSPAPSSLWHVIHSLSAMATVALTVLHLGLHADWVWRTLGAKTDLDTREEASCAL